MICIHRKPVTLSLISAISIANHSQQSTTGTVASIALLHGNMRVVCTTKCVKLDISPSSPSLKQYTVPGPMRLIGVGQLRPRSAYGP